MRKSFQIPSELLSSWWCLSSLYGDYLPDLQMGRDSFCATRAEAAAVFQQLNEMKDAVRSPAQFEFRPSPFVIRGNLSVMGICQLMD
jgi:hypothetical protein